MSSADNFESSLDSDPNKMLGLIWIQTVWQSDGISEYCFVKRVDFEKKNQHTTKKHEKLLSRQLIEHFYAVKEHVHLNTRPLVKSAPSKLFFLFLNQNTVMFWFKHIYSILFVHTYAI